MKKYEISVSEKGKNQTYVMETSATSFQRIALLHPRAQGGLLSQKDGVVNRVGYDI